MTTLTTSQITKTAADAGQGSPAATGRLVVDLDCHRNLRGPYTAGGQLLRLLTPDLMRLAPQEVAPHSGAVVAIAPDLAELVPAAPQTLTNLAEGEERTRYYSVMRTRDLAQSVSELVLAWIATCHPGGVTLRLHQLQNADATDEQLVQTLRRRGLDDLDQRLDVMQADSSADGGAAVTAAQAAGEPSAQQYVDADGTWEDPLARAAYDRLSDEQRQQLHSARAELLAANGEPGSALGALLHHLERGSDAAQAAPPALLCAVKACFNEGFYDAVVDLAERGRALSPWAADPLSYSRFTQLLIGALTYLDDCERALVLVRELRRLTTDPADQMRCCYTLSMLYTRHLPAGQQDQDVALEWVNTAIALADGQSDPVKRGFFGAFMRNARALVEMHRGNLPGSLVLVNEAIDIAENTIGPREHQLHRSVLLTNRGRVLNALKDYDGALADYNEVIPADPEYDELYFERAGVHRSLGDVDAALRDLDETLRLRPTFVEAHYNRADLLLELGEERRALDDLDAVLVIDPDHVESLINRAALLLADGRDDAAAPNIDHGLAIAPDNAHLWSAKGLLEAERGQDAEALVAYGRALELDPGLVQALGNRSVLLFSIGQVAAAVADLDRAIAVDDCAPLRLNRGIGHHELGNLQDAIDDFQAALAMPGCDEEAVRERLTLSEQHLGQSAAGRDPR